MNRPTRFLYSLALLLAVAAQALGAPTAAVIDAESKRIDAMNEAKDAVLAIFPANGRGGGSGVVISPDGYALTNYHVVRPCGKAMQCGMADGKAYDAVLVGLDPTGDVALIKLFGRDDFPCAEMADSGSNPVRFIPSTNTNFVSSSSHRLGRTLSHTNNIAPVVTPVSLTCVNGFVKRIIGI